ncbi:hypothetical protein EYZ11_012691 [Aspergillus tanneri]|uniref:FAR1 domain-containing protein n=1 Tax=Aspergillus tanneri TaxID=1220188 RepID=A0A4S3IZK3_9EURO|nr:hypothetical protein EYZ11_012691 [Aspergillus tanneri]
MASNQSLVSYLQGYESSEDEPEPQEDYNTNLHRIPLPPYLEVESFDTEYAAIEFINEFGEQNGFAVTIKTSKTKKNNRSVKQAVYLKCDRGGNYENRVQDNSQRQRHGSTRLTGCPFSIVLHRQRDDSWKARIRENYHNHEPSPISTHPVLRKHKISQNADNIKAQFKNGLTARQARYEAAVS